MKSFSYQKRGFTLIEFLLYMALSVIMVLLIGAIGIAVLKSNLKAQAQGEVRYDGEFLLEKIRAAIQGAEAVESPSFGAASSSITLTMEDESRSPTLIELREGGVYMQEGSDDSYRIAGEDTLVTELIFTNMSYPGGGDTVRVEFTIEGVSTDIQGSTHPSSSYYTTMHIPYSL